MANTERNAIKKSEEEEEIPPPQLKYQPTYSVQRPVISHRQYVKQSGYEKPSTGCLSCLRRFCKNWSCLGCLFSLIPILEWLSKYSLRHDLIADLAAGITVAVLNIPHGIAYSILAGLPPQCGLYMAVYPVLAYVVLGTSRHVSTGTFAVASMMTLKVVTLYSPMSHHYDSAKQLNPARNATISNGTINYAQFDSSAEAAAKELSAVEVATALAMAAGLVHIFMALLHLGVLASLLSEPLVSGFLTGCAFHVGVTQLRDLLGIHTANHKGYFKLLFTVRDLLLSVRLANPFVCALSALVGLLMILCNELCKPWLKRFCRYPFPFELLVVMGGTLASALGRFEENFDISLVGDIPVGLPGPSMPNFKMVMLVALDSLPIVIVTYSTVMSIGLTYAKRFHYHVRANQELLALGTGNLVASFFLGFPMAASLSRSVLQVQSGGKTQLATVVSAMLMIVLLLWFGRVFADLPRCVLAAIIIVSLKSMFWQIKDLRIYAREGLLEMWTWIITFLTVVIVDIDIGLYVGLCFSLLALWVNGFRAHSLFLGLIEDVPAVYVNVSNHPRAQEPMQTKIYRYTGALNFATRLFFRQELDNALQMNRPRSTSPPASKRPVLRNYVVLLIDLSMVGNMDISGCRTLHDLARELLEYQVRMLLACPNDGVYDILLRAMKLGYGPFEVFSSLHDGVLYAEACR